MERKKTSISHLIKFLYLIRFLNPYTYLNFTSDFDSPQVCDDEWHHYAVSVNFPDVQLYVDGALFKSEKKNPEVIDDWPLHPTKGINTTLTVGACWQGKKGKEKWMSPILTVY